MKRLCSRDFASKRMNGESSRYDKLESMLEGASSEPHNVPLKYLRNITNDFSNERLLGEGGFGTVYKGVLQNGKTIAVKKLNSSIPGVMDKQFENEANHLMRLKHPNVVLLVGWCSETENVYVEYNGKYICAEKSERLLCLEYMPRGNLRGYLSDASSGLDWDTRYKIIEGICYGLRYLHEQWQPNAPIVHMDMKPANILLDDNMVPKIADFGLSRLFNEQKTWTCTISRDGTLGYMSPEYTKEGLISTKSDIFSLGVIIIEIVTGGRDYPDDTGASSEEFIEMVINKWSRRKRVEFLFGHVSLEIENQQIRKCIQIGLDCVKIDRFKRPTISQIIKTLHGLGSADSSNIKGVHRPEAKMRPFEREEPLWACSQTDELPLQVQLGRPISTDQWPFEREKLADDLSKRKEKLTDEIDRIVQNGRLLQYARLLQGLQGVRPTDHCSYSSSLQQEQLFSATEHPYQELQSGKRERNCGETNCMERPAKKHTPGFSRAVTFIAMQQWQKKTALRRIRVIFTTVVFVVLLKKTRHVVKSFSSTTE